MLHRLYGSVRPKDHKTATKGVKVTPLDRAPSYVVLPVSMHAGNPCVPVVKPGDPVLLGQKIAEVSGPGAPVHASVSGTVTAVEPRPHPNGSRSAAIVIENDFRDTAAPPLERRADPENLTCWEIADLIADAGIVEPDSAGRPTAAKLKNAIGNVDTLIINGIEDEPYVTADHRLMLEESARILGGVKILMQALNLKNARIAIAANKMNCIWKLRSALPEDSGIKIVTLKNRYPQGAEKQLIQTLTGRRVPPGKLPTDVNCVVFHVSTAAAVYDAVVHGTPLTHRIITVSGGAVSQPRNLLVPVGTPLAHLLDECEGLITEPGRVLLGGPMKGVAQRDLEAPIIKSSGALLFLHPRECSASAAPLPCIRCGRCIKACPMNLTPTFLALYAQKKRFSELERLHVTDCIECGSCAYSCPSHIPLVQHIRAAKDELRPPVRPERELYTTSKDTHAVQAGKEDNP